MKNSSCSPPVLLLTPLMLLFGGLSLSAQIDWQRLDETADGPINRVNIRSIVFAADGTPVVVSGHGIYRIEEREIGDVPTPVGIRVDSNITVGTVRSWSDALYAFTQQAIYRSGDNGITWTEQYRDTAAVLYTSGVVEADGKIIVPNPPRSRISVVEPNGTIQKTIGLPAGVLKIASTPSGAIIILRSVAQGRLMISNDLGESWEEITTTGIDSGTVVTEIIVLSDAVFALRSGQDLFITGDGGEAWHRAGYLEGHYLYSLFLTTDGTLYGLDADLYNPADGFSLSTSTDLGRSWQRDCTTPVGFQTFVDRDGMIYSQSNGEIIRKRECADDWEHVRYGFRNVTVKNLLSYNNIFYGTLLSTPDLERTGSETYELYRSDDAGNTWKQIAETDGREPLIDAMGNLYLQVDSLARTSSDPNAPYVTLTNFLRSDDRGESWSPVFTTPITNLPGHTVIGKIRSHPDGQVLLGVRVLAGAAGWRIRLFSSFDGGETFFEESGFEDTVRFRPFDFELLANGKILVPGYLYDGESFVENRAIRFNPIGDEWSELSSPAISSVSAGPDGVIYGWGYSAAFRTTDGGENWETIPLPASSPYATRLEEKGGKIWLLSSNRVFSSSDNGLSWMELQRTTEWDLNETSSYEEHIPAIVLEDGTIFDSVHVDRVDPWFGTFSLYHYYSFAHSTDGGESWSYPVGEVLDRKYINSVALGSDGTLLVGTGEDGIYGVPAPAGVHDEIRIAPDDLTITVLPNPVRDRATISFYLSHGEGEELTLTLYDLLGRRVEVLYRGDAAQGSYPVEADFSRLASGVYFLRLQRGEEGRTEGFILRN